MNINSDIFKKMQKLENINRNLQNEDDMYLINLCLWCLGCINSKNDTMITDYGVSIIEIVDSISDREAFDKLDTYMNDGYDLSEYKEEEYFEYECKFYEGYIDKVIEKYK